MDLSKHLRGATQAAVGLTILGARQANISYHEHVAPTVEDKLKPRLATASQKLVPAISHARVIVEPRLIDLKEKAAPLVDSLKLKCATIIKPD